MTDQGNLFATPDRPKKLLIVIERLWERGDEVASLRRTTWGSKSGEHVWSDTHEVEGQWWEQALQGEVEASIARFCGTLWARPGKSATAEQWRQHWGG